MADEPLSRSVMRRVVAMRGAGATYDEMASMLRRLEWAAEDECQEPGWCQICGNHKDDGHEPDCDLAALLRDLP